jgi:carboxymethylproline synthase
MTKNVQQLDQALKRKATGNASPATAKLDKNSIIKETLHKNGVMVIEFNHPTKKVNPFNMPIMKGLSASLKKADRNPAVKSVVVYGGQGRHFSAGGDFNELKEFEADRGKARRWAEMTVELYLDALRMKKPTVAALDHSVIGIGFQFAMVFDRRIGSTNTIFSLPHVTHGIACVLGPVIVGDRAGHAVADDFIFGKKADAEEAYKLSLLNHVVSPQILLPEAIRLAEKIIFPTIAFQTTKASRNGPLIEKIRKSKAAHITAHCNNFAAGGGKKHFSAILEKNKK